MKKKEYILILIVSISLYIPLTVLEFAVIKEPVMLGTLLISLMQPLFDCGYIGTWIPRANRSVLVTTPRTKWKQCVLSESLGVAVSLLWLVLAEFSFNDSETDYYFMLCCFSLIVLFYIYSNVVPEYSVKRKTARTVLADVVIDMIVLEIVLFSNMPESGPGIRAYCGIGLCLSVYIAWFVSLFIGYRCHVKALEYKD